VTIHAPRKVSRALSNGNRVAGGSMKRVPAIMGEVQDPFPKPCYLFAMVAAKLDKLEDQFINALGPARAGCDLRAIRAARTK